MGDEYGRQSSDPNRGRPYYGEERRTSRLSEEDVRQIAEVAAGIVEDRFYASVGKTIVKRILFALGTGGGFIAAWEAVKPFLANLTGSR